MIEYQEYVERLARNAPGSVCACGFERLPVELSNRGWFRDVWACQLCEVRLIDEDGELLAATRHPDDENYEWLPENLREPGAWAGFTEHRPLSRYLVAYHGVLWVGTGHVFLRTGLEAGDLQAERERLPSMPKHEQIEGWLVSQLINGPKRKRALTQRQAGLHVILGSVRVAMEYAQLVEAVWPEAAPYVAECNTPVLYRLPHGAPVALVAPCRPPKQVNAGKALAVEPASPID